MAQGVTAPAPVPVADKTKVFETPKPAAAAKPDLEKTQVFQRPAAAAPLPAPRKAAPPPPPSPAPEPVQPKPAPGLRFRYCPSCTTANPPDAVACSRCGTRLAGGGASAAKSTNWGMYIAIGVAVLLTIVLIVVLVAK
jgi:predicted nucleic acid-binding Zn ribbon protein